MTSSEPPRSRGPHPHHSAASPDPSTTSPAVGSTVPEHHDASDDLKRLRVPDLETSFHVVLVEPEIPPNTGNVARLCAATNAVLHLVHPLGFRVDEKAVRRAGLDYWHLVRVVEHENFEAFLASLAPEARLHFFSGKTTKNLYETRLALGDYLVFGRESTGLESAILARFVERTVAIPTLGFVRSLNLANSVSLAVYEGLRQNGALGGGFLG